MREDYAGSAKFGTAMNAYLYEYSLGGTNDEETGSVEYGLWAGRIGRRVLLEDGQGFVYSERYPTADAAHARIMEIAEQYDAWSDDDA